MAYWIERHHVIPISLDWPHEEKNIIPLTIWDHKLLHEIQNINYREIRRYREKTNHIIVPNSFKLEQKGILWKSFFKWIHNMPENIKIEQITSMVRLIKRYKGNINDIDTVIDIIIEEQRKEVNRILYTHYS